MAAFSSIALGIGAGISTAGSLIGASQQARAMREQAAYQKQVSDFNSKMAELQAEDAIKRGDDDAQSLLKQGRQLRGAQRAALAAQGIDIDSGSAADVQDETYRMAQDDARKIRNNAAREAFGFKVQAQQYTQEGKFAQLSGERGARGTLLTGAFNAAGSLIGGAGSVATSIQNQKILQSRVG